MLVVNDQIADIPMLEGLLSAFGITLETPPALPIRLQDLVYFLQERNVDHAAVGRFIEHVNQNIVLFSPRNAENPNSFWWPNPTRNDGRDLSTELFWAVRKPIVDKGRSKIVSLGSCFAEEVAKHLQANGYNYLVTEPNLREAGDFHLSSARWGALFNVYGFLQVVSWAFGFDRPPMICYDNGNAIRDPFREDVTYTPEEARNIEQLWHEHLKCSRAALEQADIVILTIGLNEVFRYLPTGHHLHRTPWGLNPALWDYKILTPDQNYEILKDAIEKLRQYNPDVKMIVSVSPVPLSRTFRQDVHVTVATMHSKAVLRTAVEMLCRNVPEVYYMASFETVMYPGATLSPWSPDLRHVSDEVVRKIMRLFETQFCGNPNGEAIQAPP